MPTALSSLELLALVAMARLGDEAYAVTIRLDIQASPERDSSVPAVYAAPDRLERSGLVEPWLSESRPERGGRARRHSRLTPPGRAHVMRARDNALRMWSSVPLPSHGRRR